MATGDAVKPLNAAFGQITRCTNCTLAYSGDTTTYQQGCEVDAEDAAGECLHVSGEAYVTLRNALKDECSTDAYRINATDFATPARSHNPLNSGSFIAR